MHANGWKRKIKRFWKTEFGFTRKPSGIQKCIFILFIGFWFRHKFWVLVVVDSVTSFGEISGFGKTLKIFGNYFISNLVYSKVWTHFGKFDMLLDKFSMLWNGQILQNNLAIRSHWSSSMMVYSLLLLLLSLTTISEALNLIDRWRWNQTDVYPGTYFSSQICLLVPMP